MNNETNVKVLGVTDTVGTCDCCGRTDLKKTIILQIGVNESVSYFGVTCAARKLSRSSKGLMNEAIDAQMIADREKKIAAISAEQQKKRDDRRAELLRMSREDFGTK